jgi:hypothetical protein
MSRADLLRAEQSFHNPETKRFQLGSDRPVSGVEEVRDVLDEQPAGPGLDENAAEVGPQVALVAEAAAPAGDGVRLAGDARHDAIHAAAPAAACEGSSVRPDRRAIQGLRFHPGHEQGRGVGFPFDVADGASSGAEVLQREMNADVEHSAAGSDGEDSLRGR